MVFHDGTQAKKWTFSKEELFEKRKEANRKCKAQLKLYDQNLDVSLCISELEEGKVVDSFLNMIRHFYRKFRPTLPMQVYGISVTYFRRFFLKYSVMDFSPREIIVACIYVACKIAEFPISIDVFLKNIPKNGDKYHNFIFNSEMFLIDELDYDLWIYTPYEPFKAFLVELKAFQLGMDTDSRAMDDECIKLNSEKEQFRDILNSGINIINDWYQTDLMMMFSPDHVALAAVEAINSSTTGVFHQFVQIKICKNNDSNYLQIMSILDSIKMFVNQELIVTGIESLKVYEPRIDTYRNPKYNVNSEVYQKIKQLYDEKHNSFD